ncbi:MAG: ATP-binding SpoIIE family protein phosphatase [Steroidobacteraceae bacterium]
MQVVGAARQVRIAVDHESAIGEARRVAQRMGQALALGETDVGRVGIIASELGTNLWRHAGGGDLFIQAIGAQIEILAVDRGRGMENVDRCLQDGYSTGGTAGQGLGAVRRASSEFDIYSAAGKGCVVVARVGLQPPVAFGAICCPLGSESVCGDAWRLAYGPDAIAACVVDGLGHGPLAAEAAEAMADAFAAAPHDEPRAVLERAHGKMSGTRGAAAACSKFRLDRSLSYAGVGNISGHLLSSRLSRGMVSHSGILGVQVRRIQQVEFAPDPASLLVMHSDGVSARWTLSSHPGLEQRHPSIIAALLFREHSRPRDDATILVVRQ